MLRYHNQDYKSTYVDNLAS